MKSALALSAVLAAFGLVARSALAAPQMLGVVASAEPVPMHCANGVCSAELSALCLEKERALPQDGTPYDALDPEKLSLVVTASDGSLSTVPASGLRIVSRRSQVAIEVSLPEAVARKLGAVALAVKVAPELALIPAPVAGDASPIGRADVARARDALATARALLAQDKERVGMAALMNRLINALPGDSGADPIVADRAWQGVAGVPAEAASGDPVVREAAQIYRSCRLGLAGIWPSGLRRCLEFSHDATIGGLNAELWQIVGTGS